MHMSPALMAVGYPWYLAMFYQFRLSERITEALLSLGMVFAVPGSAFVSLYALGRTPAMRSEGVVLRRVAYLAFVSPSLFVIVGVFLYLMKIEGKDVQVWVGFWLAILCAASLVLLGRRGPIAPAPSPVHMKAVRVMHGTAALVILLVFLVAHLVNHTFGLLGADAHREVMLILRNLYRSPLVEPALLTLLFFQVISGLILAESKIRSIRGILDVLQTASGAYLAVFIASHINAVFVLARYFGTETDYAWATALPKGLLADPWDVRLIPHYMLGVWLVLAHIACGLRVVLVAHRVERRTASAVCWALIVSSTLWAAAIVAGAVGFRV
jgi:succinate dehydrogenase/fumarate reductase cytochrome b subunit